jgi:hypothetical protein
VWDPIPEVRKAQSGVPTEVLELGFFLFFKFYYIFIRYFPRLHFQCYPKSPPYPPPQSTTHPLPRFGPRVPLYWEIYSLQVQWASLCSDGRLGHLRKVFLFQSCYINPETKRTLSLVCSFNYNLKNNWKVTYDQNDMYLYKWNFL